MNPIKWFKRTLVPVEGPIFSKAYIEDWEKDIAEHRALVAKKLNDARQHELECLKLQLQIEQAKRQNDQR